MRFHSAMATVEPQKNVIARKVGTENILLVSGRLVPKNNVYQNQKQATNGIIWPRIRLKSKITSKQQEFAFE